MEQSLRGKQVLTQWSIRPHQLLELIRKGLRAYTDDGQEIKPIYSLASRRRLAVRDIAKKRGKNYPKPDEAGVYRIDLEDPEASEEVHGWYFPLKYVERFERKYDLSPTDSTKLCESGEKPIQGWEELAEYTNISPRHLQRHKEELLRKAIIWYQAGKTGRKRPTGCPSRLVLWAKTR